MNWKPISEAPKDGTEIVCCNVSTYGGTLHYSNIFLASWKTYNPNAKGKFEWRNNVGHITYPTHWDHLPELPKKQ